MLNKPKSCPFCGSSAIISRKKYAGVAGNAPQIRVECASRWGNCPMNMRTHHKATAKEAVEAWNTRTGER